MPTNTNIPLCPQCGNPISVIRGVAPHFCRVCGYKLNPHANPAQYGQPRPPSKPYQYPYTPPKGQTIRTPAQVGELQAPVGPILGDGGPVPESPPQGVSYIQPKPHIPVWAIVVPVVIVVIVVVVIIGVASNRSSNSPYYSNSSSGSLLGGGSGGSSCISQGTLSNGCDRCLLGSAAAGNVSAEGMNMNYSYNDDGTLYGTVSMQGIDPISISGTWYCSNNQFCVNSTYMSACAPYSINGSTVSWGALSYDISIPNIPMP